MRAILIDPELRRVTEIELDVDEKSGDVRDGMLKIIAPPSGGFDWLTITDMRDSVWVDEFGLKRGEPISAFKLPVQRWPFAGKAVIIGANDEGVTAPPTPGLFERIRDTIEWLDVIVPEITWETGAEAIVTYSRPKRAG